jgi:hypothetical protein
MTVGGEHCRRLERRHPGPIPPPGPRLRRRRFCWRPARRRGSSPRWRLSPIAHEARPPACRRPTLGRRLLPAVSCTVDRRGSPDRERSRPGAAAPRRGVFPVAGCAPVWETFRRLGRLQIVAPVWIRRGYAGGRSAGAFRRAYPQIQIRLAIGNTAQVAARQGVPHGRGKAMGLRRPRGP